MCMGTIRVSKKCVCARVKCESVKMCVCFYKKVE